MRQILDKIYYSSGILAAVCLVTMLLVIVLQIIARWMLIPFPGSSEYAGYLMAASSFLAFAYALNSNAHIRVTLFIKAMGRFRFWGEIWCFAIGALATTFMAWYACKLVYWSVKFGDVSQGQDATPLWIVQTPVAFGSILLALCFWDNLFSLVFAKNHNIVAQSIDEHGE